MHFEWCMCVCVYVCMCVQVMPYVRCAHGVVSHSPARAFYVRAVQCNRRNNQLLLFLETTYDHDQICTFCGEMGYLAIFDVVVPVDTQRMDSNLLLVRYKSHTHPGACATAMAAVLRGYNVEWGDNCAVQRLCADLSGDPAGLEADEEHF